MELSWIVFGSAKHHRHLTKQIRFLVKLNMHLPYYSASTGCLLKTFMWMFLAAIIIIVRIGKETQMSINWWMDIQIVVHLCNAILLCNIKEWTMDIHSMTESQKHYVNCKVPYKRLYSVKFHSYENLEKAKFSW